MQGELATLLRWLTALPDVAFESRPTLALNHAFTLAVMDHFPLAEHRLAAAERALHSAPEQDVDLLGQAAVVRAAIALQTDLPAQVTFAASRQALELLPQSSANWRGLAGLFLGVAYYAQAGDLGAGYQTLIEAEQTSLGAGDPFGAANIVAHLCILLEIGGRLGESERLSRENQQRAAEPFWQGVPLEAYAGFGLGRVLYERNDLLAARDLLTETIRQLEAWALKRPTVVASVVLVRVYQALGEPEHAREAMNRVVRIVQKDDLKQTFSHWEAFRARIYLAQGDLTTAARWAKEVEPTIQGELNPALEFKHITLAQIYLAQQRLDDAQRLLERLLPAAQAAGRLGRVLEIYLLQALTADAQGRQEEALTTLERALNLAEPEGYIRTFVDLGPPMAALLHKAYTRAIMPAYVARLLAAFSDLRFQISDLRDDASSIVNRKSEIVNLVEPLSKRELEILSLMAQGLTNVEIAQQIFISDQTVKVHTRNIYGKLGVSGRRQAVSKAKALGLLA
jgi:LuxR family maltose regulon positive regulatory protein